MQIINLYIFRGPFFLFSRTLTMSTCVGVIGYSGSLQSSINELAHTPRLISGDLANERSESLSPAELSIFALPIRLGDVA